jgi:hypothetical protein
MSTPLLTNRNYFVHSRQLGHGISEDTEGIRLSETRVDRRDGKFAVEQRRLDFPRGSCGIRRDIDSRGVMATNPLIRPKGRRLSAASQANLVDRPGQVDALDASSAKDLPRPLRLNFAAVATLSTLKCLIASGVSLDRRQMITDRSRPRGHGR